MADRKLKSTSTNVTLTSPTKITSYNKVSESKHKYKPTITSIAKIIFMVALIVLLSSFGVKGYIDSSYIAKEETTTITHIYYEETIVEPYSTPLFVADNLNTLIYANNYFFNYTLKLEDIENIDDIDVNALDTFINNNYNLYLNYLYALTNPNFIYVSFDFNGLNVVVTPVGATSIYGGIADLVYGLVYGSSDNYGAFVIMGMTDDNFLPIYIGAYDSLMGAMLLQQFGFLGYNMDFHLIGNDNPYEIGIVTNDFSWLDTYNITNQYFSNLFGTSPFTDIKRVEKTYSYDVKNVNYDWDNKLSQLKTFKPLFNANITFINEDWVKIQNYITYTGTYTGNAPNQDIAKEVINKYYNDEKLLPLLNNNGTAYVNISIKTTKIGLFKNDKQYYSYIEFLDSVDYSNPLISDAYNYAKDNYLSSYNESSYLTKYEFTFNDFLNVLSSPFQIVYNLIYNFGVFIRFITIW